MVNEPVKRFGQRYVEGIGWVIWDSCINSYIDYDVICQYLNDWDNTNKEEIKKPS